MKANNEAKDEEKLANVHSLGHEQIVQKTQADKKRKLMQDQAQAVGNPNLLEDEGEAEFQLEVEQDKPEVQER